jgi:chemotaxis protein methyltransferase CheR
MPESDRSADEGFVGLLDEIERSLSFATGSYNDAYLDRRISARMRRRRVDDYEGYAALLRDEEEERGALLDSLSVNVTSFFRNPKVWTALRDVLAELSASGRARVWSAACSDGREAYSLAMLAHDDDRIDPATVDILGTDIKPQILRAARAGEYRASETNDLTEQLSPLDGYERFVERDGDAFRVRDDVRDLVSFRKHDLVQERPPRTFDLVLCRNLFIYINSESKRAIFDAFGSALVEGGYLTIGMTETIPPSCRDRFDPVEKRLRIYRNGGGRSEPVR